jgi:hypothetical protein
MKRTSAGAGVLVIALIGSLPAHGQVADLSQASCGQLMDLPSNDRGQLIVWLHGYYAGAAQRAIIDRTKLEDAKTAIEQACERNRATPLIGMEARALFLGEVPAAPQPSPTPSAGASSSGQSGPSAARPAR